jgi:hypothetical protein
MNEQIEKLIDGLEPDAFMTYKSYLYHANDPKVLEHSDPEPLYTRQELEKFAKLIIRESVKALWTEDCHVSDLAIIDFNEKKRKIYDHMGVTE